MMVFLITHLVDAVALRPRDSATMARATERAVSTANLLLGERTTSVNLRSDER
jgi:hypothetical protein